MVYKRNIIFLLLLFWTIFPLQATSLKTEFSELLIENLSIGKTYSFKNDFNYPFNVSVEGKQSLELSIQPSLVKRLKPGFEHIPDLKWVHIEPNQFTVQSNQTKNADIIIKIPNDPNLIGKKYAIGIKTIAKPAEKQSFGLVLSANAIILITVTNKSSLGDKGKAQHTSRDMNFLVQPLVSYLSNIDIRDKNYQSSITIINQNKKSSNYSLRVLKIKDTLLRLDRGYEDFPDLSFITLMKNRIKIKGNRNEQIYFNVNLPNEKKYKNKKYAFIISVDNEDVIPAFSRYIKVYVHTMK